MKSEKFIRWYSFPFSNKVNNVQFKECKNKINRILEDNGHIEEKVGIKFKERKWLKGRKKITKYFRSIFEGR